MKKKDYKYMLCALALATSLVGTDVSALAAEPAQADGAKQAQAQQYDKVLQALSGKTVVGIGVRGMIHTKEEDVLAAVQMKVGDVLSKEALSQDQRAIYETGNFFDVAASFEQVPEGVKVVYTVMENPVLQEIVVRGNTKIETEQILSMLTVKKGEVLNTKTLNANVKAIEEAYREQGYIFTKASDVAMSDGGVLTLTFNEGTLEGFSVKGNEKTKDYVITREMRLKPGEPFNVKDARRSMQRVYNLGFFEDVNMKLNPGREPNAIVLETDVVERQTGRFSIGGGYSDSDGIVGIIEVGDDNFRGMGDSVKVHWEFGGDADVYDNYRFSYTRPWLDSKQTSATFSIYNMTTEYDDYAPGGHRIETYDRNYKGVELTLGRPESEYSTNYITLRNRTDRYEEHVSGINQPALDPNFIDENFGNTRSIGFSHVTDTRDNIYNATEGSRAAISAEFAGFMGGDFDYNKYTFEDRHYFKVGRNHVIATRATLGFADGDMPKSALFDVGGQSTLRGYEDEQFQGEKMAAGTIEYRFPIVKKIQGALFTDFGDAWGGRYKEEFELHVSYGVGVQIDTPLGPIRLDYGRGEDGGKTHFSFGGSF